jgi:hypothetical protein
MEGIVLPWVELEVGGRDAELDPGLPGGELRRTLRQTAGSIRRSGVEEPRSSPWTKRR